MSRRYQLAPLSPRADAVLRQNYPTSMDLHALAKRLGLRYGQLLQHASQLGIKRDPHVLRALQRLRRHQAMDRLQSGHRELTGADLYAIEKRLQQGQPLTRIAQDYPGTSLAELERLTVSADWPDSSSNGWRQAGLHALAGA